MAEFQAQLAAHLGEKAAKESELKATGVLSQSGKLDPSLHGAARQLERQFSKDVVSKHLADKPSLGELTAEGIIREDLATVAPSIQPAAASLSSELTKVAIKHKVGEVTDETQAGKCSPARHGAVVYQLDRRPSVDELVSHGVIEGHSVASSLAASAQSLQHALTRDSLKHQLERRPSKDADQLAASLASSARSLEQSLLRDSLKRSLSGRPDQADLAEHGILEETQVAPALASTTKELERKLSAASLSKSLRHRPAKSELEASGVLPPESTPEPISADGK